MTIKEAILKSLEKLKRPSSSSEIYEYIVKRKYYNFSNVKTPKNTISATLGTLSKNSDSRVKRVKNQGHYLYYLSKDESLIDFNRLDKVKGSNKKSQSTYSERDLHKLLSSYLKSKGIYSKTILHEESKNTKDNHQKWIHPDMIGIEFLTFTSKVNKAFMKILNRADTFKITSYEIKREINTDYELKKSYFQAVSNSSWANYGYLVAFDISDNLKSEMERLNQSFGIGIIELKANPYESKILYQAKLRELDFKTIDKLCRVNEKFEKFIELVERILTIDERNYKSIEKELNIFCDDYFKSDSEIKRYCKEKSIPFN
jgi:hypothetical protein